MNHPIKKIITPITAYFSSLPISPLLPYNNPIAVRTIPTACNPFVKYFIPRPESP